MILVAEINTPKYHNFTDLLGPGKPVKEPGHTICRHRHGWEVTIEDMNALAQLVENAWDGVSEVMKIAQ